METFANGMSRHWIQAVDISTAEASTIDARTLGVPSSPLNLRALAVGSTPPVDTQLLDNGSVFHMFTRCNWQDHHRYTRHPFNTFFHRTYCMYWQEST